MMPFIFDTPIFGSYSLILAISVILVLIKLFIFSSDIKEHTQQVISEKKITETPVKTKTTKPKVKKCGGNKSLCTKKIKLKNKVLHIYYTSISDISKQLLDILTSNVENSDFKYDIIDLSQDFNIEEQLPRHEDGATIFILDKEDTIASYGDWLYSSCNNPKMEKNYLKDIKFAVFDCSSKDDSVAVKWDKYLWKLGGRRLKKVNTSKMDTNKTISESFKEWEEDLMVVVQGTPKKKACACGPKKKKTTTNDCDSHSSSSCDSSSENGDGGAPLIDVEDLLLPS